MIDKRSFYAGKLLESGPEESTDAELLAVIIGTGNSRETAEPLCQRILEHCSGSLEKLEYMEMEELCRFPGIGRVKALTLAALWELARRRYCAQEAEPGTAHIGSPEDAMASLAPYRENLSGREYWLVLMTAGRELLAVCKLAANEYSGVPEAGHGIALVLECGAAATYLVCLDTAGKPIIRKSDQVFLSQFKTGAGMLEIALDGIIYAGRDRWFRLPDTQILGEIPG